MSRRLEEKVGSAMEMSDVGRASFLKGEYA